jgi:hypothetical protein
MECKILTMIGFAMVRSPEIPQVMLAAVEGGYWEYVNLSGECREFIEKKGMRKD